MRALRRLHDFGYAHRDIKPGNILRRPKQHDWTLIDFGCSAPIGMFLLQVTISAGRCFEFPVLIEGKCHDRAPGQVKRCLRYRIFDCVTLASHPAGTTASLSLSLKYAAPEVVRAYEAGHKTISVDAAVDIWAVGVIAFELLTQDRAFPSHNMSLRDSDQVAQEAIAGRAPLPWEGSSAATKQRLIKLRGLRRTVRRCLERNPARRPTAAALLQSLDHTFDNMSTRGTDWSTE